MRPVIEIRPLFYQFGRIRHGARCPGPAGPRPKGRETPDCHRRFAAPGGVIAKPVCHAGIGGFPLGRTTEGRPRRARAPFSRPRIRPHEIGARWYG